MPAARLRRLLPVVAAALAGFLSGALVVHVRGAGRDATPGSLRLPPPSGPPRFVDVSEAAGLVAPHRPPPSARPGPGYVYDAHVAGAGVACGDVDGDGLLDLYLPGQAGPGRLYRNLGGLRFSEEAEARGARPAGEWAAATLADLDNDGDADLLLAGYRPTTALLENEGAGHFRDRSRRSGLLPLAGGEEGPAGTGTPVLGLVDGDENGLLDVVIGGPDGVRTFDNHGALRFDDTTGRNGVPEGLVASSVVTTDVEGYGHLALALGIPGAPDRLLVGDGNGRFDDVPLAPRTSFGTTGLAVLDHDGDGRLDLFSADLRSDLWLTPTHDLSRLVPTAKHARVPEALDDSQAGRYVFGNALLRNTPAGPWEDRSGAAGVEGLFPWGAAAADFDLDGHPDLFVPSGLGWPWAFVPDALYRSRGDGRFSEEAEALGLLPPPERRLLGPVLRIRTPPWAAVVPDRAPPLSSRSAAACDLDEDGDLDLIVRRWGAPPALFENRTVRGGVVRLVLRLRGVDASRDAVGARVAVTAGGRTRVALVPGTTGHLASPDRRLFFGLPAGTVRASVRVTWPGGGPQTEELAWEPGDLVVREVVEAP